MGKLETALASDERYPLKLPQLVVPWEIYGKPIRTFFFGMQKENCIENCPYK